LLTVLLAVHNGERYLTQTIESILSQSYAEYEFLIIDDGSRDSTPHILKRYAQRDRRIRLLRHDNRGVGYTLNRGLAEARGALIAQIGADDLAISGRLQKQVDFLQEHPEYVLVGGYLRIIDRTGRCIGLRRYPTSDRQIRKRMVLYNPFGAPAVMFRRDEAVAAGGFTSRFWTCEDYDFVFRIARRGKVANLAEPLTEYRLHGGSVKSLNTLRQLRDTIDAKRAAYSEYGYRQSIAARMVNGSQELMMRLPPRAIYWLFSKVFIRSGFG
jgi:glycosyltransferase involved in cell wall biosynthesis